MDSCRRVREELTAWVDGELQGRSRHGFDRHLATCEACRAEAALLRCAVVAQTALLRRTLLPEPSVGLLWTRLQGAMQEESPRYRFLGLRGLALFSAAAGMTLVVTLGTLGGPAGVLVPMGAKRPPAKVQSKPTLFQEYPIIERLEILENLDTVEAVQLEEETPTDAG